MDFSNISMETAKSMFMRTVYRHEGDQAVAQVVFDDIFPGYVRVYVPVRKKDGSYTSQLSMRALTAEELATMAHMRSIDFEDNL